MTAPHIQAADRRARRRVLWLGAGATLAGGALLLALPGWLGGWAEALLERPPQDRARVARYLAAAGAVTISAPVAVLAVYFLHQGRRVAQAGRFPPPGVRVLRDTAVLCGADALAHARRLRALGWVCVGSAAGMALWSWSRLGALATLLGVS